MLKITRLTKLLICSCALFLLTTTTARADTVSIVGNANGSLATATLDCSFNAPTNTFTFTITNTSPFDARITGIGFDLPPGGNASASALNGFSGSVVQPVGVDFAFSDGSLGNVPQFDSAVLDFGFLTGSNFAGGSPNDGLPTGFSATFTVSGAAFLGFTEEQICNAVFARFQRVGANGQLSDVGTPGTPGTPVPEPTTMLLLGSGLVGVVGAVRRRRKTP